MTRHDFTMLEVPGVGRVALVLPVVPEDAPPEVREGIARRRIVMTTGRCPCGARRTLPNRAQRRAMRRDKRTGPAVRHVDVEHEPECPATSEALARHGWVTGAGR